MKQRFAIIVESIAQAALDCYVESALTAETVSEMQRDLRCRFRKMIKKIGQPVSERAADWIADEHLRLARPNGKETLEEMNMIRDPVRVSDLRFGEIELLKKLFPADVSDLYDRLNQS